MLNLVENEYKVGNVIKDDIHQEKRKLIEKVKEENEFDNLIEEIAESTKISETDKRSFIFKLQRLKRAKINILITGATGCGKSSTINALFGDNVAKIGQSVNPETMDMQQYVLNNNLILWDSPGLGDGKEADLKHIQNIINKLQEKDDEGNALIDLVLVILDGSSRDLGTSYQLINEVVIPNLGENTKRLLVAINQCDMAMKGRYWDDEKNCPEELLVQFLDEKVESVKKRIQEATGEEIEAIYYSAGYKDGDGEQYPYNLSKLLMFIAKHTKEEKRVLYQRAQNKNKEAWARNDGKQNYNSEIKDLLDDPTIRFIAGLACTAIFGFSFF